MNCGCKAISSGCGRNLCENHIEVFYEKHGMMINYACKDDSGIRTKDAALIRREGFKLVGMITLTTFIIALTVGIIYLIAASQNLATWDGLIDQMPKDVKMNMTYDSDVSSLKFMVFLPEGAELKLYTSGYIGL